MKIDMIKYHTYYSDLKYTKRSKTNYKKSGHQLKYNMHLTVVVTKRSIAYIHQGGELICNSIRKESC